MSALISGKDAWGLAVANFSNPVYISTEIANTPLPAASTGFDIGGVSSVLISFEGTYTGLTVAHEQTLDPTGVAGWFSVAGQSAASVGTTAPITTGSASGSCYVFPAFGLRHRIRVTALSSGTVVVRVLSSDITANILAAYTTAAA